MPVAKPQCVHCRAKPNDSARIVVLPAWREADLLQYAKSTEWAIKPGLRLKDSTLSKLVKKQWRSLREFCKEREKLKSQVARDCHSVDKAKAFALVYNYGGVQNESQVDQLRRHYIRDCHKEDHYQDSRWWKILWIRDMY